MLLSRWLYVMFSSAASDFEAHAAEPYLVAQKVLDLRGPPYNEGLATHNMAMNVWHEDGSDVEFLVAQVHQNNDFDKRSDDSQYGVVWQSNGVLVTEVNRIQMSCPDVDLMVPREGPYVYEVRLQGVGLHPECNCKVSDGQCPRGVRLTSSEVNGSNTSLTSPQLSHFVVLENQLGERISNSTLPVLLSDTLAPVKFVTAALVNATQAGLDIMPKYACPGSYDDDVGNQDVTLAMIRARGMTLPAGHVDGAWCVVYRGYCSSTAKVKVCEASGAKGTILIDNGNFPGDQEVHIRYDQKKESAPKGPVLFLSPDDGHTLWRAFDSGDAFIAVGPSIGGPPPPGYNPGSGIIVHTLGGVDHISRSKSYPGIFDQAGWIECSKARDLLFACLPALSEVRIYDRSDPLVDLPHIGTIKTECAMYSSRDYRILDYKGHDGKFKTLLIDPANVGNLLLYFDTDTVSAPILELALNANWEDSDAGLGQVRAGGPDDRYHIITWHCSSILCDDSMGANIYILDTWDLKSPPRRIPLPMLTKGSTGRDVACGEDHLCIVTLTWDGFVALDSGVKGSLNTGKIVASYIGTAPFNDAIIPETHAVNRMYAGAQKAYASRLSNRSFYIENAQPSIRGFQYNSLYGVTLVDYTASEKVEVAWPAPLPAPQHIIVKSGTMEKNIAQPVSMVPLIVLIVLLCFVSFAAFVMGIILYRARQVGKMHQKHLGEILSNTQGNVIGSPAPVGAVETNNLVVGRPVAADESAAARSRADMDEDEDHEYDIGKVS